MCPSSHFRHCMQYLLWVKTPHYFLDFHGHSRRLCLTSPDVKCPYFGLFFLAFKGFPRSGEFMYSCVFTMLNFTFLCHRSRLSVSLLTLLRWKKGKIKVTQKTTLSLYLPKVSISIATQYCYNIGFAQCF